jgi:transposase-like protein
MSLLSQKHLQDDQAAYAWVEARVWPDGPVCPHCQEKARISKMQGKATRMGLYKCSGCRKQFRVTVDTIFEKSHVALHLWLQAFYLIAGSKKGISSNQLHRTLGVTLKTPWFMGHRIREAMRAGSLAPPMGGDGGVVEVDETYFGTKKGTPKGVRGFNHKFAVITLVKRGGEARSFHIQDSRADVVVPIVIDNIADEARLATDEAQVYKAVGKNFAEHGTVKHRSGEYVRGDIHTNTVEGYFSIFKRGMKGVYQHCGERHLHRYLGEFDFRYNNRVKLGVNDEARAARAVTGVVGKRLTYRPSGERAK